MAATPTPFSWTLLEGRTVIREIIEARILQWTTGPRPAQLECWSHTLAGIPTILIALTGWGKTTAFFVPILILQHLLTYPKPRIPQPPPHLVALVVTPLIELSNAHCLEIATFGLKAISLTAESLAAASKDGQNLLKEISECQWDVALLSAESATISPGPEFNSLCDCLGLKTGKYHTIRESSKRPNVQMIFKQLTHRLGGYQFPDIAWVFRHGVKAVVYCHTIDLGFRVGCYRWNLYPEGFCRLDNVRLWTSVTLSTYNNRTLDLFKSEEDTSVIITSIAFGMGMNLRNITDSINLGIPTTYAGLIQQNGCAGRNRDIDARGWTYVESAICAMIAEDGDERSTDPLPPIPVPLVFTAPNVETIPSPAPLTKKVCANFSAWLECFAVEIWNTKDDPYASILPFPAFWHRISQDQSSTTFTS
ncbi:hypothetical protein M413DRAFT_13520 [Hebeloma cylindrosporum]|uniref:DNA 3'-5' helicase n=1 Tax=Hebeloma cylindrosporum TaxID=76867 RepID=A0A0C3BKD5_HEBCY|nr:hypothetical protein M413DRAFT_13520 [Hebeloma cylindrosporum h7]